MVHHKYKQKQQHYQFKKKNTRKQNTKPCREKKTIKKEKRKYVASMLFRTKKIVQSN